MNRKDVGDGMSFPLDVASILPGDFIASRSFPVVVGEVLGRVYAIRSSLRFEAFLVRTPRENTVIAKDDARILGYIDCQAPEEAL